MDTPAPPLSPSLPADIAAVLERARTAQAAYSAVPRQKTYDIAAAAAGWALYDQAHAESLAESEWRDTKLGKPNDKIEKIRRKIFGTLCDLKGAASTGEIERDEKAGLIKYAKPVGVVAAICPSTNPVSTAGVKALMALKGGNAVIFFSSPAAHGPVKKAVEMMRNALRRVQAAPDLLQMLPAPVEKARTQALTEAADLVIATGSAETVRRAQKSGTPTIGVGTGNVPAIIDETADPAAAAEKIARSKSYDNGSSCSSESCLIAVEAIYDSLKAALKAEGGWLASPDETGRLTAALWPRGRLSRALIASDASVLARAADLPPAAWTARFFVCECNGVGPNHPLSGEKLSLVLSLHRAADFPAAIDKARDILNYQGLGHSCGLHTSDETRGEQLAAAMPVARVLVNQAHTFGHGGGFDNGLNFTQTMPCGSWGGNTVSENLNYRHFLNLTQLALPIEANQPKEDDIFADYRKHIEGA